MVVITTLEAVSIEYKECNFNSNTFADSLAISVFEDLFSIILLLKVRSYGEVNSSGVWGNILKNSKDI